MKKIKVVLYGSLMAGILLCVQGCSVIKIDNSMEGQTDKPEIEFELPEQVMELALDLPIEITTEGFSTEASTTEASSTETDSTQLQEIEVPDIYYTYHKLDNKKQKLYMEIYNVLNTCKENVILSTTDKKIIDELFVCVMNDHPELFYVKGYTCTEYSLNNKITEISFSGTYTMTYDEIELTKIQIEDTVKKIMYEVPLNEDEYYTIKYIYEYLINNTQYNKAADNNQNICSVFIEGQSVCQGYAKAMQYLLQKSDIQCCLVTGFAKGERHAWNLVRINGEYYYIDTTWGDASYSYTGEDAENEKIYEPELNYDYFLVTTDEIIKNHSIEETIELPECTSVEDNYFYREGLYFKNYDEEKLNTIFGKLKNDTEKYVTLKCGSESVYDEINTKLINEKKIFEFMENQEMTVAYSVNENQLIMSFWTSY